MMRQAQGTNNQAMSFGKSRARMFLGNKTVVTFADVAGVDEAKTELQEVVEFLKYPEKFNSLGARIPRGVLLVGPPGTGKTLMARAVAGEAGVPFFSISGSEFVEMFVGVGASRVRDLFDQAKRNAPCIVFVDEIDAVGRQRGAGLGGSHDEREQTLNQILVEMDGFDTNTNVIVVAATNRPDVLDPALLRPGRFDRQVILDRPDMKGRVGDPAGPHQGQAARQDDRRSRTSPSSRPASPAPTSPTSSTSRRSSPRAATRSSIGMPEFQEALERIMAGPERKSRVISDAEKLIIAYHEGGHAVVQRILPKCDPVSKVTIISRGMALGYTMALPDRGSLPPEQDGVRGQDRRHARRQRRGAARLRRHHDRRLERHREGDRSRPPDGHRVRHERPARAARAFGKRDELVFLGREIGEQRNYSDDVAKQIDEEVRSHHRRRPTREPSEVLTQHRARLDLLAATPRREGDARRARSSRRSSRTSRPRSRSTASSRSWPRTPAPAEPPDPAAPERRPVARVETLPGDRSVTTPASDLETYLAATAASAAWRRYLDFLRIPSICGDPRRTPPTAGGRPSCWPSDLAAAGLEHVEVAETGGHPIVYARLAPCAAARRPSSSTATTTSSRWIRSTLWEAPPFEPIVRDGRVLGAGRRRRQGPASRSRSPRPPRRSSPRARALPVNLKLVFEGEEEIQLGPPRPVAGGEPRARLAADVALIADTGFFEGNLPGDHGRAARHLRGQIDVRGPDPGPPLRRATAGPSRTRPTRWRRSSRPSRGPTAGSASPASTTTS